MRTMPPAYEGWLLTRPPAVRALAAEFPPYTEVPKAMTESVDKRQWFVFGYAEPDTLIITCVDPAKDYYEAKKARRHICAQHFRDQKK